jgi:hypothetical protein
MLGDNCQLTCSPPPPSCVDTPMGNVGSCMPSSPGSHDLTCVCG